jgi:hypothetical protein
MSHKPACQSIPDRKCKGLEHCKYEAGHSEVKEKKRAAKTEKKKAKQKQKAEKAAKKREEANEKKKLKDAKSKEKSILKAQKLSQKLRNGDLNHFCKAQVCREIQQRSLNEAMALSSLFTHIKPESLYFPRDMRDDNLTRQLAWQLSRVTDTPFSTHGLLYLFFVLIA